MTIILLYTLAAAYGVSYLTIVGYLIYNWVKGIPIFEDYPDEEGVFVEKQLRQTHIKNDYFNQSQ